MAFRKVEKGHGSCANCSINRAARKKSAYRIDCESLNQGSSRVLKWLKNLLPG